MMMMMMMMMMLRSFFLVGLLIVPLLSAGVLAVGGDTMANGKLLLRHFQVVNQSGKKVTVEWINPESGQSVPLGAPTNGESITFNSFVNHTFVIKEEDDNDDGNGGGDAVNSTHHEAYYKISENGQKQVVVVKKGLQVERLDSSTPTTTTPRSLQARDIVESCRATVEAQLRQAQSGGSDQGDIDKIMNDLTECLEDKTTDVLIVQNKDLANEASLRKEMSDKAENYTCADDTRETSEPIEIRTWTHHKDDDVVRQVHVLHNRPGGSQIHLIHNFISPQECEAIRLRADPILHRGTVADGKGGSRMSDHRKAWQAGLKARWDEEHDGGGDAVAVVSRRLFDYANSVTRYNMTIDGQEDLMSIQYFGEGRENPTPDRYTPHCDGACDGLPHKMGGRVATMVMYCDVPESGGGTNFQNANVFVKPVQGAAAFFSYLNADTMRSEEGFTSHSGCPVLEGTKRIAVQWMRVGVDSENPWDSFDTNTVKKSDYKEQ
jgi:2OG-Fe(II) oxygenase superfamily